MEATINSNNNFIFIIIIIFDEPILLSLENF